MLIDTDKNKARDLAGQRFAACALLKPRSFLSIADLDAHEMKHLIHRSLAMKNGTSGPTVDLRGLSLALLFQKTSTRTRCSFENAAFDLGMFSSYIDWRTSNFVLADLCDEIRVLSRYYDFIAARVLESRMLRVMAENSEVPVINGMCDREHPCQALADFTTLAEYFGPHLEGLRMTYVGEGNNVCRSLALGAGKLGIKLTLCCPENYRLDEESAASTFSSVSPAEAVSDADVIYTDTWISIGRESETERRLTVFAPYQVNEELLTAAPGHTLVMHCLPAHPGQEIAPAILRGPRSIVFDQAENRLHAQKALLEWLAL
jgi:ornithine carbamoyltransferase